MTNPKSIKERIEKVLSHEGVREWVLVYDDPEKIIGSYKGLPKHDDVLAHTPVIDAAYVTRLEEIVKQVPDLIDMMSDYDCGREIVKSEIDGVQMLGTKHATNCGKCAALANLQRVLGEVGK